MTQNFSCGIYPVNIAGPPCSGNGECVFSAQFNRGICVCNAGWHGESDIQVTTSLTDCHIYRDGLLAMWAVFLLVQLVFGMKFVPKLIWLFRKHEDQRQRAKEKGRTYTYFENKPLLAWMPYFCLGYPAQLIYTLSQLGSLTEMNLGRDIVLTATYIIWRFTFYIALFVFQSNFLASLLKAERSLDGVIKRNFIMSYLVMFSICAVSVCIIIPHVLPFDPFDPYLANVAIFFGACSLCFLFVVAQTVYIRRKVIKILDRAHSISDPKSKRLRDKIITFQLLSRNTAAIQFVIYGFFCAFPYMWNKHDWLMPISWFAVLRTMLEGLNSLVDQEQTHSTGNSGGLGSQHQQQGSRKRSSLLETIKNRIVRRASNGGGTKEDSIVEEKPIVPQAPVHISVEMFPEDKGMFEHSMQRATVGKQAKKTDQVPQWAMDDQESISKDMITSSAKVEQQ